MTPDNDQQAQWLAYHLGELSPEDRRRVEEEMERDPATALAYEHFVKAIGEWAKNDTPYTPVDTADLIEQAAGVNDRMMLRPIIRKTWPWALAAALLLVAFSLGNFSMQFGDTVLAWGEAPPDEQVEQFQEEIESLTFAHTQLEAENKILRDLVGETTLRLEQLRAEVEYSTALLVENQRKESQIRYSDTQRLFELNQQTLAAMAVPASFNPNR